jgi:membrane-associated protease RseP (regulator of RpoE activity)
MTENLNTQQRTFTTTAAKEKRKKIKNYLIHIGLFIITFITTTLAGVSWTTGQPGPYELSIIIQKGLPYSVSLMLIITFHEFGHYFAAVYHRVRSTLPFYIPFPPIPIFINFGTLGAVIKTKSPIFTKKAMFDIGVAGPIAEFIISVAILIYGFMNVPGIEYILNIHPDYLSEEYGKTGLILVFGDSALFLFLKEIFVNKDLFFPPMSEIYHYPYLTAGWFGLFVTSMNMIPVGQLDGGHISYTMFGEKKHYNLSVIGFIALFVLGITGIIEATLEMNMGFGWSGWLFWALILYFIIKLKHPPVMDSTPLDNKRMILGYISFIIFIISFSPAPIVLNIAGQ